MEFVKAIPASEVKVGNVFYADGFGYAVIVLLVGSKMAKAYTSYGRPIVLLADGDTGLFKVYPQLDKGVKEIVQVDGKYIGDIRTNEDGDDVVYTPHGKVIGYLATDGDNEVILKDGEVIYKNIERVGNVELGPVCDKVEYVETGRALNIELVDNWKELLGDNYAVKLKQILIEVLNNTLHASQLSREDRKWAKEVIEFRAKQKPLRVNGKMFKPKASRFVCGFIRDNVLHLYFIKKITDVIYKVTLDKSNPDAKYVIEECDDEVLRGEIQKAVREGLIPMAAYDAMFGKRSMRTTQVSGQIPVELHERMKWGGYSLPQVIHAGIQALEDRERNIGDVANIPNIVKGYAWVETARQLYKVIVLNEDL